MNYSNKGSFSKKVYKDRTDAFKEKELKAQLERSVRGISKEEVRKTILSWKKCLRAILRRIWMLHRSLF